MNISLEFIHNHKVLAIASCDQGSAWIANIFVGVDEHDRIYFISSKDAKHSKMILENPTVAFSAAWFDAHNHADRKGIQGTGICRLAESDQEMNTGVSLHNAQFPAFKQKITRDWIRSNESNSCVWVLEPRYIKFWNDALYGEGACEEFHFS